MANLRDGLGGEEVNQEVTTTAIVSGTNVYATSGVTALTVTNDEGELRSVKASDAFGGLVQGGSSTLSSNVKWVVFDTAYSGTPAVNVTNMSSVGSMIGVTLGSLTAGSFLAEGPGAGASDAFSWVSVGI